MPLQLNCKISVDLGNIKKWRLEQVDNVPEMHVIQKPVNKKNIFILKGGSNDKKIAQKIFTDTPIIDEVETLEVKNAKAESQFEAYYKLAQNHKTIMPNVVGLPAMDAIALLENMQVDVKIELLGAGIVKKQSVREKVKLNSNQTIVLNAS